MDKIGVVGVGNPWRGDDAIGWAVIDTLEGKIDAGAVLYKVQGSLFEIIDLLQMHEHLYLIDAWKADLPIGSWQRHDAKKCVFAKEGQPASSHGLGVAEAIAIAKNLDQMPASVVIYAVCAKEYGIGQKMDPQLKESIEHVAQAICKEVEICMKKGSWTL